LKLNQLYGVAGRERTAAESALALTPVEFAVGAVEIPSQIAPIFVAEALARTIVALGCGTLIAPFTFRGRCLAGGMAPVLLRLQTRPEIPRRGHGSPAQKRDAERDDAPPHFHPLSLLIWRYRATP
jgi:hypothetical protein